MPNKLPPPKTRRSLVARICIVHILLLLAGCPTQQEYAETMQGHWLGSSEQQSWCISLNRGDQSIAGEGSAIYRGVSYKNKSPSYFYAAGVWYVGVGGRWQVNLNPQPLDKAFNPQPAIEIRTESIRYLIKQLNDKELVYREHTPDDTFGDTYISSRVDSCENFYQQHENPPN